MFEKTKEPKGCGELVLYLDFDGVLHHERCLWSRKGPYIDAPKNYTVFQHVPLLESLLAPYPTIKIVLSTSWVRSYGCTGATKRLSQSLRERVIGATFHSRMNKYEFLNMPRGMQVWADVLRRHPKDWLALDDDWLHWPTWCLDNFIRTHDTEGISHEKVLATIKEKLKAMHENSSA